MSRSTLARHVGQLLLTMALSVAHVAHAADALPALLADPTQTSVSGLSSGAFMAVQYQVAFSSTVIGAGVVAGGPYYCAGTLGYDAVAICVGMVPFLPPNPGLMLLAAETFANAGQIDPLTDLKNDRIYVFSGTKDRVVYPQAVDATVEFFKLAGVPSANIAYVNHLPAGHALITPTFGNVCATTNPPYINHCTWKGKGYDQAGALLTHIYGKLNPAVKALSGRIVAFNQREFADASSGMADDGYVYVPKSCSQNGKGCKVHIALHGCEQSAKVVGKDFYSRTGYNNWADSNKMLVLYPQVNASSQPYNPKGCWDWVGYTGPNFAVQSGVQLSAIKAMVDRLTHRP
ncbi:extracellular catalytic domain type 2 short-chain-length polyhydroxyalkanoate depolymerase [Roseateles sp. GG27B]